MYVRLPVRGLERRVPELTGLPGLKGGEVWTKEAEEAFFREKIEG